MSTLFIADLHLDEQQPAITAGFVDFLQREAYHADALYILGDLFEFWVGDDYQRPLYAQVAAALRELTHRGVPCYFIHGNRDFLLGKRFAAECGMTLLPETFTLSLYGQPIAMMHGDTLCTDDHAYLRLRKYLRHPILRWCLLSLPVKYRLKIAAQLRSRSQYHNTSKMPEIMDVNPQAVVDALLKHQVRWLIHGHTHKPAIHSIPLPDHSLAHRAVLGAWHSQGSMIRVSDNGVELITFPF